MKTSILVFTIFFCIFFYYSICYNNSRIYIDERCNIISTSKKIQNILFSKNFKEEQYQNIINELDLIRKDNITKYDVEIKKSLLEVTADYKTQINEDYVYNLLKNEKEISIQILERKLQCLR